MSGQTRNRKTISNPSPDPLAIPDWLRRPRKRGRKPKVAGIGNAETYVMPEVPEEHSGWPKVWAKAKCYRMYVQGNMSICGYRQVRVVIGRKWVRLCTDSKDSRMRVKWKMSRKEWDRLDATLVEDAHV